MYTLYYISNLKLDQSNIENIFILHKLTEVPYKSSYSEYTVFLLKPLTIEGKAEYG